MAWWKIGEGDDVCGDWPADILGAALQSWLDAADTGPTPGLSASLRVLQDALNAEPRALLSDADATAYRLAAEVAPISTGATRETRRIAAASEPSALPARTRALEALRRLAQAYRDAVDRAPRTRELAHAVVFSWANAAEDGRFAEGPCEIARISIEPYGEART